MGKFEGKVRVLVVDDDPVLRHLFKRSLEKLGVVAMIVADGQAAREAVLSHDFDLVLMDQHLTGERGTELTSRLRTEARAAPKWVCISGSISGKGESLASFDGAAQKPATVEEMRKLLAEWLPVGSVAK